VAEQMIEPMPEEEDTSEALDYAALKPAEEAAEDLLLFIEGVRDSRRTSGIGPSVTRNWHRYYGTDDGRAWWSDGLYPEGKQGEKIRMRVNVTRKLIRHILSMVNAVRPPIDPKAANTDAGTIKLVEIARSVAEHYLKVKKVYRYIDTAIEHAVSIAGAGFVWGEWDDQAGDDYAAPQGQVIKKGDVVFRNPSLLDVYFDQSVDCWEDVDEIVVRTWRNKYEWIARYPNSKADILKAADRPDYSGNIDERLPTPSSPDSYQRHQIEEFTYYHRKNPAVPNGRRIVFLADGAVLEEGELHYSRIPLFRVTADEVIGSPHGYCPTSGLAPMQEALDKMWSINITDLIGLGGTTLAVDRNANVTKTDLEQGVLLECDFKDGHSPIVPLEKSNLKPEMLKTPEVLAAMMTGDVGLNETALGNPPPGLNAAIAVNLFQSMAMQFATPLEGSRAELIEDLVMWIYDAHQQHPDIERDVQIVGKSKREALEKWYGRDLKLITRVHIDLGNPMSRTVAGRMQILQSLQQNKVPLSPQQALEVLNTGNLENATEGATKELTLIKQENEMLAMGEEVSVGLGENHPLHIFEHAKAKADPTIKFNPELSQLYDQHIMQHVQIHSMGDVANQIAMMAGLLPLGSAIMPMPPPGPGSAGQAPGGGPPGSAAPGPGGSPMAAPPPAHAQPAPIPGQPEPLPRAPPIH
jgi:hypothetical protein